MKRAKKIGIKLIIFGIIVLLTSFAWPQKSAFAQTQTTFTLNLASNVPSANSNLTFTVSVPEGEILLDNMDVNIPVGWDIRGRTDVDQDVQVASGTIQVRYLGTPYDLSLALFNEQETLGDKARWKVVIGDEPFTLPEGIIYWNWIGSAVNGYTLNVNSPIMADLATPLVLNLTFFGLASSGQPVLVNPTTDGEYIWSVDLNYSDGSTTTLPISFPISSTATGSVDGTLTNPGVDVTNTIGSATVQYSSVSSLGSTTLTSTTSAPAEGTGQFQPSGGLYYDFNTTATITCPCTIILPYDPVTTPNPRIYHLNTTVSPAVWEDATTNVDTVNHTVTGVVSSFSFFAVGQPNFILQWSENLTAKLTESNPFQIEKDTEENFNFTIFDSQHNSITPQGVVLDIWQTYNASGNPITPVKKMSLVPEIVNQSFQSVLDLEETPLDLGIYQVRILIENTTATQQIQANFKVVREIDSDNDGFSDKTEAYLGTDPHSKCSIDITHAAWPADLNNDRNVNSLDALAFKPYLNTLITGVTKRYDLYADGKINIIDVLQLKPYFGKTCQI